MKKLRVQSGLSAKSLALTIGVAVSTYREWENCRAVSGQPYKKISVVLNLSVSELLGFEDYSKTEIITRLNLIRKALNDVQTLL